MKLRPNHIILLVGLLLGTFTAKANHIFGGNISYEHVRDNIYVFTATYYLECNPNPEITTATFWIYPSNSTIGNVPVITSADAEIVSTEVVDTRYPFNPCLQNPRDGECLMWKLTYRTGEVAVPQGFGPLDVHTEEFNRSEQIDNLTGTTPTYTGNENIDAYGAYFYSQIPDPLSLAVNSNNSGTFNNDAPVIFCVGDTIRYDNSVTDIDGDSIVYFFCDPVGRVNPAGGGPQDFIPRRFATGVDWDASQGYNTDDQIASNDPFTLDPATGELYGIPSDTGEFVYVVCFQEYRNGVLINEGNRDYMVRVDYCDPIIPIPQISGQGNTSQNGMCYVGDSVTVSFQNQSVDAQYYFWDFGDPLSTEDTSSLESPSYTYTRPGSYLISLVVNPGTDCEDTTYQTFQIYPDIDSILINEQEILCEADTGNLYDFYITGNYGPTDTVLWHFGANAVPQQAIGDSIEGVSIYGSGTYEIVCEVFNPTCYDSDTLILEILDTPEALYEAPDTICVEHNAVFTSTSIHSNNYAIEWSFPDSTEIISANSDSSEITVNFQSYPGTNQDTGWKYVDLTVYNFLGEDTCQHTYRDSIYLRPVPEVDIVYDFQNPRCIGDSIYTFYAEGYIEPDAVIEWFFFDPSDIIEEMTPDGRDSLVIKVTKAGTFRIGITITHTYDCQGYDLDTITFTPDPISHFYIDSTTCLINDIIDLTYDGSDSGYETYLWDFGPTSRYKILSDCTLTSQNVYQLDFLDTGYFDISLTLFENGCDSTYTETIYVGPVPESIFDQPEAQCIEGNNFNINHTGSYSDNATFKWEFEDAAPSPQTGENAFGVKFNSTGLKQITLTTYDFGCEHTYVDSVHITPEPFASFIGPNDTCLSTDGTLDFLFNGTVSDSAVFTWDLGLDAIINSASTVNDSDVFTVSYGSIGPKTVTLSIEDNGCIEDTTYTFTIVAEPIALFDSLAAQCFDINSFNFTNTGVFTDTATFLWEFGPHGPPNTTSQDAFGISFDTAGYHAVRLTVFDHGCSNSYEDSIYISPAPISYFEHPDTQCVDINFYELSAAGHYEPFTNFLWDFGPFATPSSSTDSSTFVTFSDTGHFVISLTASLNGCDTTYYDTVVVTPSPIALFDDPGARCISGNSFDFYANHDYYPSANHVWVFENANIDTAFTKDVIGVSFDSIGFNKVTLIIYYHGCVDSLSQMVEIKDGPIAHIKDEVDQCILNNSFLFDYSNSRFTPTTEFMWVFGPNANVDTVYQRDAPIITYDAVGSYDVYLQLVEDTCTSIYTITVNVTPEPDARFSTIGNDIQCIAGNQFDFIPNGIFTDSASFLWGFTDYTPVDNTEQNQLGVVWTSLGWKYIQLTISDNGCTDVYNDSIFISPIPTPIIAPNDTQCLASNNFDFDATLSQYDTNAIFSWVFENGTPNTSNDSLPKGVVFNAVGWHTVSLTIEENGCDSTVYDSVYVNPTPTPSIGINDSIQCIEGQNFDFFANGSYSDTAQFIWTFENGAVTNSNEQHPTGIQFNSVGTHKVSLIVSEYGCSIYTESFITVTSVPVPFFAPQDVQCIAGNSYDFYVGGTYGLDADFYWDFGPNASPQNSTASSVSNIQFNTVGWQYISLTIAEQGCDSTYYDSLFISPVPVPIIAANEPQCLTNNTFNFDGSQSSYGANASFLWSFENGSPGTSTSLLPTGIVFNSAGWHTISLTIEENGCDSTLIDSVYVSPEPDAFIIINDSVQCIEGQSFDFTVGGIYSSTAEFHWAFQNGTPTSSRLKDPTGIVFNSLGTMNINLRIDDNGCIQFTQDTVRITPVPEPAFAPPATQCVNGNSYDFNAEGAYSSQATFYWDFGPNATPSNATEENPTNISFTTVGWQYISLTISQEGCDSSYVDSLYISPIPVPDIAPNDTQCLSSNNFSFDATSSSYDTNASFFWAFEDALPSSAIGTQVQNIVFQSSGWKKVRLTISENGCDSTHIDSVYISPIPEPEVISIDSVQCINGHSFDFIAGGNYSSTATFSWVFENGSPATSNDKNPSGIQFNSIGNHTVSLTISEYGCSQTSSKEMRLVPPPDTTFYIAPSPQCISGNSFSFVGEGGIDTGVTYIWIIENSQTDTLFGKQISGVKFDSIGFNTVTLTLDQYGCTTSFVDSVFLSDGPVGHIAEEAPQCLSINAFDFDYSKSRYTPTTVFYWVFQTSTGYDTLYTQTPPTISYDAVGNYDVFLVLSEDTCIDVYDITVTITPPPLVEWIADSINCIENAMQFLAAGSYSDSAKFDWFFENANTEQRTEENPDGVLWSTSGWHTVMLTISDNDCSDSYTDSVYITDKASPVITAVDTQCLGNNSFVFDATNSIQNGGAAYYWDFGPSATPQTDTGATTGSVVFDKSGIHTISLRISEYGCDSTISYDVAVVEDPLVSFYINDSIQCLRSELFDFANTSSYDSTATFLWEFENGKPSTSTLSNVNGVSFTRTGHQQVRFTIEQYNCSVSYTDSVLVTPVPEPFFTHQEVQCIDGNSYDFTVGGTYGPDATFAWGFGLNAIPNTSDSTYVENVVFNDVGWNHITLTISEQGCDTTYFDSVYISPVPVPVIAPTDTQCLASNSFNFDATLSEYDTNATFFWSFENADPSSSTDSITDAIVFQSTGWHTVMLTITDNGCDSTIIDSVYISPTPEPALGINDSIQCIDGQGFDFEALGQYSNTAQFAWTFENGTPASSTDQNPVGVVFGSEGLHHISLSISEYGCEVGINDSVIITPVPEPFFSHPNAQCIDGNSYTFESVGTYNATTSYQWTFENANLSTSADSVAQDVVFNQTGWNTISLEITMEGCTSAPYTDSVYIYPRAVIYMPVHNTQCLNQNYFNLNSSGTYSDSAKVYWTSYTSMGTDTLFARDTAISYSDTGYYRIGLFVDNHGCLDSIFDTLRVVRDPSAYILPLADGCKQVNTPYTFTLADSSVYSNEATFNWIFENANIGGSSQATATNVQFLVPGSHLVTLEISDGQCSSTDSLYVDIPNSIVPTWSLDNSDSIQCVWNNSYDFTLTGSQYGATATFYWDFGIDAFPESDSSLNPTKIYFSRAGSHEVRLTITEFGCSATYLDSIFISPEPVAIVADIDTQCVSFNQFSFDASSSKFTDPNANFYWDFGPNANTRLDTGIQVFNISYSSSGTFTGYLSIEEYGCDTSIAFEVTVSPAPNSQFTVDSIMMCADSNLFYFAADDTLQKSSSMRNYFIIENDTIWNYKGYYSFAQSGTYDIVYEVSDFGCTVRDTVQVVVYPNSVADLRMEAFEGCVPLQVNFTDNSVVYGTPNYWWSFGDGNESNEANPSHLYETSGSFTVMHAVWSDDKCSLTDTMVLYDVIEVYDPPISDFEATPYTISFTSKEVTLNSLSYDSLASRFMVEDTTYYGHDATHTFSDTGWFAITHIVDSRLGCSDTSVQYVYVDGEFRFYSPNAFSPNGDGYNETFQQKGYGIDTYYIEIYNRWGELVFKGYDIDKPWTGEVINTTRISQDSEYIWRVELTDFKGVQHSYKGKVTIVH